MRHTRMILPAIAGIALLATGSIVGQTRTTPPDFRVNLSGREENPVVVTNAHGRATFRLINLGSTILYRVSVRNLDNVVGAHIHLGPQGVNGPVVAFLAGPEPPGGGPADGILAEGTIESQDLTGPLVGQSLSVLIEAMRTGGAYVNVHTDDGIDPINTGPGDFPGGEIRGQIGVARAHSPQNLSDQE